jgi:serpin B
LPKFTIESSFGLKKYLNALGMNDAFILPGADFSGMDGTNLLGISEAFHKAWVKIDEEGTEAAATSVRMLILARSSVPSKIFRADHPFIFLIRDNSTGSILFIGRLSDPTEKENF